ncbi:MAG: diguanylate cyclase [Desulfuromonadaceae bacterium]|nr:diguanylate cyclase [Desulfuromonadaceae bacterium]MDD2855979.1 diguanylate cyclase [Desulfuromonadaceae bacterium]
MTVSEEKPLILIVEDDPVSRSILELHLEHNGYPFVSASNGLEALRLFSSNYFPIVITDWLMPEMDGTALCRAIRERSSDRYTFIILLTSKNSPEALIEGLEAGADDYIVKPINPAELRVRLQGCRRILDLESSLKQSLTEIRNISIRDKLTGAFNRGYLDQQLEHEIERAYRYQHNLSLIMCDLDHFKKVNDNYGHQAGDEVLKRSVQNIVHSIRRQIDWVARYGGEEFVIALPETDAEGCVIVAERMRGKIAFTPKGDELSSLKVTASFGTVTLTPHSHSVRVTAADLIQRADICLYQAKQSGRNCVVSEFQKVS